MGPRVSALLGGRAQLEPVGELVLKGLSRPVEAWNVVAMPAGGLVPELVPDGA